MATQRAILLSVSKFERDFLDTCTLKADFYLRFIDDFFIIRIIRSHGEEALKKFHGGFFKFHPATDVFFAAVIEVSGL